MSKTKEERTTELVRKLNEIFELCEEYGIVVTIEGDAMSGDRLEEAVQNEDRIWIW